MVSASSSIDSQVQTATEAPHDQHGLVRSVVLHLAPGVAILAAYLLVEPFTARLGLPAVFALLIAVLIAAIPTQLGHLLYIGYRRNGCWSLAGVVVFRRRLPLWQYVVFVPLLLVWSFLWYGLLTPISDYLSRHVFFWLPSWFFRDDYAHVDRRILLATLALLLVLNGVIAPIVEELYFRGYLLPRLARFGPGAPVINLLLFTLYHFWQPWLYPTILVALAPMVFPVWWKRSIWLGVFTHCALNTLGGLATAALLLQPR